MYRLEPDYLNGSQGSLGELLRQAEKALEEHPSETVPGFPITFDIEGTRTIFAEEASMAATEAANHNDTSLRVFASPLNRSFPSTNQSEFKNKKDHSSATWNDSNSWEFAGDDFKEDEFTLLQVNHDCSLQSIMINGELVAVPTTIPCPLCRAVMKLSTRRTKYKNNVKEYDVYRCSRKKCQVYRSVSKLLFSETAMPKFDRRRKKMPDMDNTSSVEDLDSAGHHYALATGTKRSRPPSVMGTLIYLPFAMSHDQVAQLQKAAFDIVEAKSDFAHHAPRSSSCPVTSLEIKRKMRTANKLEIARNMLTSSIAVARDELKFERSPSRSAPATAMASRVSSEEPLPVPYTLVADDSSIGIPRFLSAEWEDSADVLIVDE